MKRSLILPAMVLTLSACHSQAPQSAGQTQAQASHESMSDAMPLSVAATSVLPQDKAVLAQANWTGKACALTREDDKQVEVPVAVGAPTHLAGYFIDPDDKPAGEFQIALMGAGRNYVFPAKTGWDRIDVADYFNKPDLATSGYDVNVDLANVPAGKYSLNFVVDRGPKGKFFCESGKKIVVAGSAEPHVAAAPDARPTAEPAASAMPDAAKASAGNAKK